MEGIVFLSRKQVDKLHDEMIELYGGLPGVRDDNMIESAIGAPKASFGGQLLYKTIHEMAAALLVGLACNHGYSDGNKRTAAHTVDTFYLMNGYVLQVDDDTFADFVERIAVEKPAREKITDFLESHAIEHSTEEL